jgi:crossover junction endodeoxyribonuclease RuvC
MIPCRRLSRMPTHQIETKAPTLRRILGVDPAASGPTGYGVIETDGRNFWVLRYGALRIAPKRQKSSAGACLHDVHTLLCQLIKEFHPNAMAVESVFTALNMRTALRLAEVRGVVLLAAEQHGLEVRSYSPREVKACVAGYGHADKKQMQLMVRALLKMEETPEPSDAADALAVALCHIQGDQFAQRFGLSTGSCTSSARRVAANSASRRQSPARISGLQPSR